MQPELPEMRNAYWMSSLVLEPNVAVSRDELAFKLREAGIETRPFFPPMHQLPMYALSAQESTFLVADQLAESGLNLPSHANLTDEDVAYISDKATNIIEMLQ